MESKVSKTTQSVIKFYQFIGESKHTILYSVFGISSRCKHNPSCSRYTASQIKKHGTIIGSFKGLKKILTCW